jgi:hypothetical protein
MQRCLVHVQRNVRTYLTLFTYLRTEFTGLDIASTTNRIEGGTNAQLRLLLRAHRGMSEVHQKRAIEWYLYLHSETRSSPPGSSGKSTRPPNDSRHNQHPSNPTAPTNTAPAPAPKKAPGPAKAGQDAPNTPGIYTFCPMPPAATSTGPDSPTKRGHYLNGIS